MATYALIPGGGGDPWEWHRLVPALERQSATPLDEPWPLEAWPGVATRVVAGRHDRMFPLEFQRRIARERLGLEIDEIPGGHMVALSDPDFLAERLEAYRREAGASL